MANTMLFHTTPSQNLITNCSQTVPYTQQWFVLIAYGNISSRYPTVLSSTP